MKMANFTYRSKPRGKQTFCPNHPQKTIDAKFKECYTCYAKKNGLPIKDWREKLKEENEKV